MCFKLITFIYFDAHTQTGNGVAKEHIFFLIQLPTFDAKFPARVTGIPQPEVTWHFNDQQITPGTGADTDKYRVKRDGDAVCLYVRDCKPSDSGRYKCRASNCDGEAICEASLEVVDKM
jgi:hypothetical protein